MIKPYTYLLVNEAHWYIGMRMKNVKLGLFSHDDINYMGSGKLIRQHLDTGEVFSKHILGEYETNKEAQIAEIDLITFFWDVPGRLNLVKKVWFGPWVPICNSPERKTSLSTAIKKVLGTGQTAEVALENMLQFV